MIGPFTYELHAAMADEFAKHVMRVATGLQASFDECLSRVGISAEDLEVLRAHSGERGRSITRISNEMGLQRVRVIEVVGRLREAAFIAPASEASKVRMIQTPRGRAVIASVQADWSNRLHHRLGTLSVPRLEGLCEVLRRL